MKIPVLLALFSIVAAAAELNVSRVVLYKHGVGYFERVGEVPAGDSATLQFKAAEMDDVLKSLTIEQTGGEGVTAVRYDSSDPLSKRLEVFPFRIGEKISLSDLLDQFKGAEVELLVGGSTIVGTIVSAREPPASEERPARPQLLLLSDGALRTVDPESATSLRFSDPGLERRFGEYLAVLARSRNTDRRSVTIESRGEAGRVAASYMAPAPIWKSSYRLVFDDQARPLLEGWAIVDNTTGEDWNDVRLSLVSGLPVSFVSRLYEPQYVERPTAELPRDRAWRPTIHGGAVEEVDVAEAQLRNGPFAGFVPAAAKARSGVIGGVPGEALRDAESSRRRAAIPSTVAGSAEKVDLGELFEYAIDHPVTIRKSESAMLPFFRERIEARRLYVYDESNGSEHPLAAAQITNSSGAALDGGAITVYDQGAYAGEALVETVKAGDKRLISYSVDLGSRISTAHDSTSKLQSEFHLRRGVMTTKTAVRETKTFTIRNVDARPKTIVIEHAVRPGYTLVDQQPAEKTASAYRFEVEVPADSSRKFPVVEERVFEQSQAISSMNYDVLMSWVRNKELNEEGRRALEELADLKRRIAETEREEQRLDQRVAELNEDQGRLRNNIATLRQVSGQQQQVQNYSERLASQEVEMANLRDAQIQTRRTREELQRGLERRLEEIEF